CAMSLEPVRGSPDPFDARTHDARPHPWQQRSAALLRELLADSEIRESHRKNDPRVQDAYSLRCTPQVLGAVGEGLAFAERLVATERNGATDKPLVFGADVLVGGKFAGQHIELATSVESVPTEGNQEDVVPMGMSAAWKAGRILVNAERIVAIELLAGAQGLEFLKPLRPARAVGRLHGAVRQYAAALTGDRPMTTDIEKVASAIREGKFAS